MVEGGQCKPCDPGSFGADGRACNLCPEGRYTTTSGATECMKCPYATTTPDKGNINATKCAGCDAGSYGENGNPCVTCPKGSWSEAGERTCKFCPPGKYVDCDNSILNPGCASNTIDVSSECKLCAPGLSPTDGNSHQMATGGIACLSCSVSSKWTGMATDTFPEGLCKQCRPYNMLPPGVYNSSRPDVDYTDQCTDQCPEGALMSNLWMKCVTPPPSLTRTAPGSLVEYVGTCELGHRFDLTTENCIPCSENEYALPGFPTCVACKPGYVPSENKAGCVPDPAVPQPTCAAGETLLTMPTDYDCAFSLYMSNFASCTAFAGALLGTNPGLVMAYYPLMTRLCPATLFNVGQYLKLGGWETQNATYFQPGVDGVGRVEWMESHADAVLEIAAQARSVWGLNDDSALRLTTQGGQSPMVNYYNAIGYGCSTMDDLVASGNGYAHLGFRDPVTYEWVYRGHSPVACTVITCEDPHFDSSWCAYPLYAISCPESCGGIPADTITCGAPVVDGSVVAAPFSVPVSLEFDKPFLPPSLSHCAPGYEFDAATRLIVPVCKSETRVAPLHGDCISSGIETCKEGTSCTCGSSTVSSTRKLLFGAPTFGAPTDMKCTCEDIKPTGGTWCNVGETKEWCDDLKVTPSARPRRTHPVTRPDPPTLLLHASRHAPLQDNKPSALAGRALSKAVNAADKLNVEGHFSFAA